MYQSVLLFMHPSYDHTPINPRLNFSLLNVSASKLSPDSGKEDFMSMGNKTL